MNYRNAVGQAVDPATGRTIAPSDSAWHIPFVEMMKEHPGLQELVGREVSSVEFVRGYVQIRFDGPCLSAYTMPTIRTDSGSELDPSTVGYADALVSVIGKIIEAAYQEEAAIEVWFAGGPSLAVSLRDTDRRADEAATLTMNGEPIWSW